MDVFAVRILRVLLGAKAVAREALLVALLRVPARDDELVQALSMTGAVVGCADTRAVRGKAAQVHLLGGDAGVVGEFDGPAGRGGGDLLGLGVGDGGLLEKSTTKVGGGAVRPVGVF